MFKRHGLLFVICIVICASAMVGMVKSCADQYFADLEGYLYETLNISQMSYDTTIRDLRAMRESEESLLMFGVRFGSEILGAGPISYGRISELNQVMPECSFYYVADDGEIVRGSTSEKIDDIAEIARRPEGVVHRGDDLVFAVHRLWDGVLVVASRSVVFDLFNTRLNRGTSQIETIYWNMDTGEQLFTSRQEAASLTRSDLVASDVSAVDFFIDTSVKVGHNDTLGYFAHVERRVSDTAEITAYISLDDVIGGIIRSVLSELILLPIVIIGMFYFFSILPRSRGKRKILPHVFVNFDNFFHFSVFSLIAVFLALGGAFYLQLLSTQSEHTVSAMDDLAEMASRIRKNEESSRNIEGAYALTIDRLFETIAYGLKVRPELKDRDALQRLADELGVHEIAIFDETGTVVASNTDSVGYVLSENTGAPESALWRIIRGSAKKMSVYLNEKEEQAFSATARTDAPGMIRVLYDTDFPKMMLASVTFEAAFRTTGILNGWKIYIDKSEPRTLNYLPRGSDRIERIVGAIDRDPPTEPFNGIGYIANAGYFLISSLPVGSRILVDAIPFSAIVLSVMDMLMFEFVTLLIVYALLCAACSVSISFDDGGDEHLAEYDDNTRAYVQEKFRRTIARVIIATFAITLAIVAADGMYSRSSLFGYLMSVDRSDDVDLFSIINIILVMLVVWAVCRFVRSLIFMIVANLGVRATTIGHMLSSLIKFGELFFMIFYTLVQLGVSLGSLLTGAGLAGAGIAIAGQSVVTDLLSGLFIVFEGKFGVGDWVRIGDWRGQVLEIGVRTTSIAVGGDVKVVNNSQLGGVVVLSRRASGAIVSFQIAYEEDVDRTIELLNASRKEYRAEVPGITEGPICQGVAELADSGVTMRIWAYVEDQDKCRAAERAILRVTKRILDRSGITIPFPQVVVHEARDGKRR